jgi:hypothetical protein
VGVGRISAGKVADGFAVVIVTGGTVVVVTGEVVVVAVASETVVVSVAGGVVVVVLMFTVLVNLIVLVELLPLQPIPTMTNVIRIIVPNRKNFFNCRPFKNNYLCVYTIR